MKLLLVVFLILVAAQVTLAKRHHHRRHRVAPVQKAVLVLGGPLPDEDAQPINAMISTFCRLVDRVVPKFTTANSQVFIRDGGYLHRVIAPQIYLAELTDTTKRNWVTFLAENGGRDATAQYWASFDNSYGWDFATVQPPAPPRVQVTRNGDHMDVANAEWGNLIGTRAAYAANFFASNMLANADASHAFASPEYYLFGQRSSGGVLPDSCNLETLVGYLAGGTIRLYAAKAAVIGSVVDATATNSLYFHYMGHGSGAGLLLEGAVTVTHAEVAAMAATVAGSSLWFVDACVSHNLATQAFPVRASVFAATTASQACAGAEATNFFTINYAALQAAASFDAFYVAMEGYRSSPAAYNPLDPAYTIVAGNGIVPAVALHA